jgi:hypothetical protein
MPEGAMLETPQNGGYMEAAYIAAALIYLTYSFTLWLRARKALEGVKA